MINYFKKGGTFTNIDVTKLDGFDKNNQGHEDIAWSTEKVNQVIKEYQDGFIELSRIKNSPFLQNDITFRKPRITFEYTREEMDELRKCAADPIYFADKFCKLKTGTGYESIKLRDYQQGLLEGFIKHPQCIVLASRQIGKCLIFNELAESNNKKIRLGEMPTKLKINILVRIRNFLYRIYEKLS